MDFALIGQFAPYIFDLLRAGPQIKEALDIATSNADATTKIKAITGSFVPLLEKLGASLFPKAAPAIHAVAAATASFDPNIVKWVQGACNKVLDPSPNLTVDGAYGPKTRDAVEALQKKYGLVIDGYAGQVTQALIGKILASL